MPQTPQLLSGFNDARIDADRRVVEEHAIVHPTNVDASNPRRRDRGDGLLEVEGNTEILREMIEGAESATVVCPGRPSRSMPPRARAGAYVSNLLYTVDATPHPITAQALPAGTLADWHLSLAFDASTQTPGTLPAPATVWDSVHAESPGWC